MVKWTFLLSFPLLFLAGKSPSPVPPTEWLTLEEAAERLKIEKRPVLIDLYTDWCGWCKVMDRKTYSHDLVSEYLRSHFYAVKVNAEIRNPIVWEGKTYGFNEQFKTNEFAIYLTGGELAYPTTVILPLAANSPQAMAGYMEPGQLEAFLKYFGEGHFGNVSFEAFKKTFKPSWK